MRKLETLENLIRVKRWAGNPIIKDESVSDHVWCMITLALEYVPRMNEKFTLGLEMPEVIYGIALHDIDEAVTTDIPRPVKHHDEEIEIALHNTIKSIFTKKISIELYEELESIEDRSSFIGMLVKIIDLTQAGFKMKSEIILGNKFFEEEIDNVHDALKWYKSWIVDEDGKYHDYFTPNQRDALAWLIDTLLEELKS